MAFWLVAIMSTFDSILQTPVWHNAQLQQMVVIYTSFNFGTLNADLIHLKGASLFS